MLEWDKLISNKRIWDDGSLNESTPVDDRTPFQVDYDRIIYSEPFRRLARKTQVHPLVPNDHIRNRLTHSLEVAGVGRSFGARLHRFLNEDKQIMTQASSGDFQTILQSACLVHDIGNPPFGHAGEYAFRMWAEENPQTIFGNGEFDIDEGLKNDWKIFEGNAQGFRLACRADNPRFGYMNLTVSTLASMVKYPWGPEDERVVNANKDKRKFNYFTSESEYFETAFEELGLKTSGRFIRHPFSFLSEASDDLCYQIADLEDAVGMNILEEQRVREILSNVCGGKISNAPIGKLRANAIGCFIDAFWDVFENNYEQIMNGERQVDLKKGLGQGHKDNLSRIGDCYQEIFAHRFKVATELGAFNCLGKIIRTVCDASMRLCRLPFDREKEPDKEKNLEIYGQKLDYRSKRCFELTFGELYVKENVHQPYSWWLHQILDFVSGMTDNFAHQLAREIEGF